jgi:signal transduction histidine kinase
MDSVSHRTKNLQSKTVLLEAAFSAPNCRCVVFTAVRNHHGEIVDFEFTLLSPATTAYIGKDVTGSLVSEIVLDYHNLLPPMKQVMETGITHNWERYIDYLGKGASWFRVSDSKASDDLLVRKWEDITTQKLAEKNIQQEIVSKAEEKYLSLFNATEQGFCIIEMLFDEQQNPLDYIFLDYNPAFEQQTGLTNAKGVSMKSLAPNHEQHWFEIYGNVAKTGKPISFEQTSSELLDGGWYEVSAFPLTGEKDNRVGIIFNDISERKKIEKQQAEFNKLLEEQVKERTAKLDEINRLLELKNSELAESNKELESFTYIASHDLQEPLRKLQTFTSLLEERITDPKQAATYLKRIYTSAGRMSNLIHDILQYSKLSAKADFEPVNLSETLAGVVSELEMEISSKNAEVNIAPLPVVDGASRKLQQLFSNLMTNALKYSVDAPVIEVTSAIIEENGVQKVHIYFKDNGIGFDEKYSTQIFDLFKRLHSKSEYEGTGIGLSICKKITEQHGGNIKAESEPGKGTVFIVTLPLKHVPQM